MKERAASRGPIDNAAWAVVSFAPVAWRLECFAVAKRASAELPLHSP